MELRDLELVDFRSYEEVAVSLEPGVSVFVGPNGQGKTNLVEAVGYVANHASHRVASDAPLIRSGAELAVIRANVVRDDRATLVELEIVPGRSNRARLNRSPLSRARDALGVLTAVVFAPEDLALVKGDPAERRRFLDELLVARAPRMAGVRQDYERVLKQRNALLKSAGASIRSRAAHGEVPPTLDVWDAHLAAAGSLLLAARLDLVADLAPLVAKAYGELAPDSGPVTLAYKSSAEAALGPDTDRVDGPDSAAQGAEDLALALREAMIRLRRQELDRGISLVGPHRDDLGLELGGLPAKGYASHGEAWSYALSLRLAAHDLLASDGTEPVLVLDDVFAELDTQRRTQLAARAARADQVLVTAAVTADVPEVLRGARFAVSFGHVERVP
jgi:DNA replication and repair protein RecF